MSYIKTTNPFLEIERGNVPSESHVYKFGKIFGLTTTLTPLTVSGTYQTPTTAQSLEIISSSANDTSAGTGARTVTVTMNGTTAVAITGTWFRVYRIRVTTSGTYASASASSHAGTITVRNSGAGVTWGQLYVDNGFGLGQSLIGCYTVPAGYEAQVYPAYVSVESTKIVSGYFFVRNNANTVSAPYDPMRSQQSFEFEGGMNYTGSDMPIGTYPAKSDIGYMMKTSSGTANVSVAFDIFLKAV